MKEYPKDIIQWVNNHFSDNDRIYQSIQKITSKEEIRLVRCILFLSDCDYDSIEAWVKKTQIDYRDVIFLAEYDNRSIRKYNFNYPLDKQHEYTYE